MDDVYDLLVEIKNLGGRLYLADDRIKLDIKPGILTPEISDKIKYRREEILVLLQGSEIKSDFVKIEKLPSQESYALSDGQRRLWILSQFEGGAAAYQVIGDVYLDSKVNVEAVKKSLWSMLERHESLRTVYKKDDSGELRQWILSVENSGFKIDYQDFRSEENKVELMESYLGKISQEEPDLENGPLFKVSLIRLEEEDYVLYYNLHHINTDGWSMDVFMRDLRKFYDFYQAGQTPDLAPLKFQYKDYAAWQLNMLENESANSHRKYWLDNLKGELPRLDLPRDKPRPKVLTYKGEAYKGSFIGAQTIAKLKKYSEKNGGSLFMGLIAAWNVLMYRYTSQEDIIIGTPLNGRDHADTIDQIGFYVNTLVIRNKLSPEESFGSVLKKVRQNMLDAYSHQSYPFNRLVMELNLPKDISRNTLFDIMLVFNSSDRESDSTPADNQSYQMIQIGNLTSRFDLEIGFKEVDDYIQVWGTFNPDVYDKGMVEVLIKHYKQLLNALLETPDKKISQIDYLSEVEKNRQLVLFNNTAAAYSKEKTIVDLFEEQVERTPDNIALVFGKKRLTYQQLNEKSNQLAHYLRDNYNIQPDTLIGIQLDRSEWVIISILGVLKAGGAYVPIDPEYPSSRKEYIVKNSSLNLLITEANFIYDIDYYDGKVFAIDIEFDEENYHSGELSKKCSPSDLAYVMYTSGSTGKPKGVMVEHRSIVRLVYNTNFFTPASNDRLVLTGALSFDATTFEIWSMLLFGGQLHLLSQNTLMNVAAFKEVMQQEEINVLWLTAPWFNQIVETDLSFFSSLRYLVSGGDKMSAIHVNEVKKAYPELEIVNGYGPTENTTFSTCYKVENKEYNENIPIGKPIANSQTYIMDSEMQLVPIGVMGEIYVGGDGLARGYLNQEELTKEKFIANPFKEGERIYKTGDLGKWLTNGNIEFIGRKDNQVKIRGHRIELGEIESQVLQSGLCVQSIVLAKPDASGNKQLIGYVIPVSGYTREALVSYLQECLPVYMVPQLWVELESIPLTVNGKIDLLRLPNVDKSVFDKGYSEPRNPVEKTLADIWQEVLGIELVGIDDNFFELGGHSLSAIQMTNQINKKMGVSISTSIIFDLFTIRDFSDKIHKLNGWANYFEPEYKALKKSKHVKIAATSKNEKLQKFFFCAPLGGILPSTSIIGIMDMSVSLEEYLTFYSIQAPAIKPEINEFLESNKEIIVDNIIYDPSRLSEIAEEAVEELLMIDNEGPFSLGGFCSGCLLAAEIASKLISKNKEVKKLILIDPPLWVESISREEIKSNYTKEEIVWFIEKDLAWSSTLMNADELFSNLEKATDDETTIWDICNNYLEKINLFQFKVESDELKRAFQNKFYNDLVLKSFFANINYNWPSLAVKNTIILSVDDIAAEVKEGNSQRNIFNGDLDIEIIPGEHNTLFQSENLHKWVNRIPHHLNEK
ncbi:non-ribosomal peptide synthetase [Flavobacterium sp. UGB4466]|uniref:non-ribosomal peptide synthetase n=1 Tax=Flavobacterium sp. UGB4466 TaxID=2730889 RepID=UPI00192C1981|nr:non-ribosomal peptide synthetase [Flavobacterium sp. UGB4466]